MRRKPFISGLGVSLIAAVVVGVSLAVTAAVIAAAPTGRRSGRGRAAPPHPEGGGAEPAEQRDQEAGHQPDGARRRGASWDASDPQDARWFARRHPERLRGRARPARSLRARRAPALVYNSPVTGTVRRFSWAELCEHAPKAERSGRPRGGRCG
jgi:hypothetical protein